MRLLGDANWWAPKPLRWLYDHIGLGDIGVAPEPRQAMVHVNMAEPAPEVPVGAR
jgi:RND superfamily putative drug exporter